MRRKLSISTLFVVGLFAMATAQQPPVGGKKKFDPNLDKADLPVPLPQPAPKDKNADPADSTVAAALANDPDVKIAKAKVQLAEAEVAKAKQAVVLKVLTLKASIEELKRTVASAQLRVARLEQLAKAGTIEQSLVLEERAKLENAQSALAKAETELKLLTGGDRFTPVADLVETSTEMLLRMQREAETERRQVARAAAFLALMQAARENEVVKGPIPDRLRMALEKKVRFPADVRVPFEKMIETFKKEAGFDIPIRPGLIPGRVQGVDSFGEELTIGAWFQMWADNNSDFVIVLREYGLFLTEKGQAPPDAPTITDFWKQKPSAAKKETLPEPKPK